MLIKEGEHLQSAWIINHSTFWLLGTISRWQQSALLLQRQETHIITLQRFARCRLQNGRALICTRRGVKGRNLWIFLPMRVQSTRSRRLPLLSTLSNNQMTFKLREELSMRLLNCFKWSTANNKKPHNKTQYSRSSSNNSNTKANFQDHRQPYRR